MKYLPSIISVIIEVFLSLLLLDSVTYSDKNIFSGIIILYATIRSIGIGLSYSLNNLSMGLAADIANIKNRIKKDEESEHGLIQIKQVAKVFETGNIKILINSIGVSIIYIIGIFGVLN